MKARPYGGFYICVIFALGIRVSAQADLARSSQVPMRDRAMMAALRIMMRKGATDDEAPYFLAIATTGVKRNPGHFASVRLARSAGIRPYSAMSAFKAQRRKQHDPPAGTLLVVEKVQWLQPKYFSVTVSSLSPLGDAGAVQGWRFKLELRGNRWIVIEQQRVRPHLVTATQPFAADRRLQAPFVPHFALRRDCAWRSAARSTHDESY